VTSQVHKTLNQYNAILIFFTYTLQPSTYFHKRGEIEWRRNRRNSFLLSTSYCVWSESV
jgi:hypothetical protein